MKIKYKKLTPDAKEPYKKHDDDFCYDLYATTDAMPVYDDDGNLIPNVWKYGTGIAFEIVRDTEYVELVDKDYNVKRYFNLKDSPLRLSIDGRPRSSVYKTGLSLCNTTITADEGYRGEIFVLFYDIIPSLPKYKKGDRIIQVKVGITLPVEWEESKKLSEAKRGAKGFGSTGKS
jgi:dUTP pyrophosphatase